MKALQILLSVTGSLFSCAILLAAPPRVAKAIIYNRTEKEIGTATFVEVRGAGVKISLNVHGLPPGLHGFHIHAKGLCDPPDFVSAGPHFNPEQRQHGLKNPKGPHAGDLGNLLVTAGGYVHVVILDPRLSLKIRTPNSLLRQGGTSIVIHAGADDELSDPSGHSGSQIACGVIAQ